MDNVIIQVYANRKLSKKTVDIGNMQENEVTKLIFELDEDIVALGGNVYLFVSYDGESYPYPLTDNSLVIGRELTQRKKTQANIVISTSEDTENPLNNVVWISNTLTLLTDKNDINIESINEKELPPSLKIVYDNLLNLEKDLREKIENDYWRGEKGDKGDAGSIKFVIVDELPTENIDTSAIYLLPFTEVKKDEDGNLAFNNNFHEYIYVDGAWECIGSATVEVNLDDYVKKDDYASEDVAGVIKAALKKGISVDETGCAVIYQASKYDIDKKSNVYNPITPFRLDYAVKKALSDCKLSGDDVWTEEEKAKALELFGGLQKISSADSLQRVYAIGQDGINKPLNTSENPFSSALVLFDAGGCVKVNAPTKDNHATTKKYVDDLVCSTKDSIALKDASTGQVYNIRINNGVLEMVLVDEEVE